MLLQATPLYTDTDLVAYYKLEDLVDSKGGFDLTNMGSCTFVAGRYQNGLRATLAGAQSAVYTGSNMGIGSGAQSYSFHVKHIFEIPFNVTAYSLFIKQDSASKTRIGCNYYYNGGTPYLDFYRDRADIGAVHATYPVTLGETRFHHLALTYDTSNLIGYLNGAQVASTTQSGDGTGGSITSMFNINVNEGTQFGNGIYDDFGVFKRALTPQEIRILAANSRGAAFAFL